MSGELWFALAIGAVFVLVLAALVYPSWRAYQRKSQAERDAIDKHWDDEEPKQ